MTPPPYCPAPGSYATTSRRYDAVYVALAEVLGATLMTTDARIARAPGLRATIDVVPTG